MQLRTSLGVVANPFPYLIVINICIETLSGPTYILSDTAIVSASLDAGDYGRCRFWACLAWGVAGIVSSPLMHWAGDGYAFVAYALFSILGFINSCRLDFSFVNNDATKQIAIAQSASDAALADLVQQHEERHHAVVHHGRRSTGGRVSQDARGNAERVGALRIWASEAGLDPAMQFPVLPADLTELTPRRPPSRDANPLDSPPVASHGDAVRPPHVLWTPRGEGRPSDDGRDWGVFSDHRKPPLAPAHHAHNGSSASVASAAAPALHHAPHGSSSSAPANTARARSESDALTQALLGPADSSDMDAELAELANAPFWRQYAALLREPHILVFLTKALVMGVCFGSIDGFLFVYLEKLGGPVLLMGTCLAVTCVMELPVFMYSGHILAFLGYNGALRLALAAFCLRLLAYSTIDLAPSVWMVTPVEMLHAFTFGVAWTAGVNFCKSEAPQGLQGSAQGLYSSAFGGLGNGLGGLIGGLLFDAYGGAVMFRSMLTFVVVASILIIALEKCLKL